MTPRQVYLFGLNIFIINKLTCKLDIIKTVKHGTGLKAMCFYNSLTEYTVPI